MVGVDQSSCVEQFLQELQDEQSDDDDEDECDERWGVGDIEESLQQQTHEQEQNKQDMCQSQPPKAHDAQLAAVGATKATAKSVLEEGEWLTDEHAFIGQRVLRRLLPEDTTHDENSTIPYTEATVIGWLPAHMSNFVDDHGDAAALWRVKHDNRDVGIEDLEYNEMLDACNFQDATAAYQAPCITPLPHSNVPALDPSTEEGYTATESAAMQRAPTAVELNRFEKEAHDVEQVEEEAN